MRQAAELRTLPRWPLAAAVVLAGLACLATGRPSAQAADTAAARSVLTDEGLTLGGGQWILPAEQEVRKTLDGLDPLVKRLAAARQTAETALRQNEVLRQQLQLLEKQGGDKNPPDPKSSSSAGSGPAGERPDSKQPDVTGVGEQTPLQLAMIDWSTARTTLLLACLDIDRYLESLDTRYAALASNAKVRRALAEIAGAKLGPAKDYRRDNRLVAANRQVLTGQTPIYRESGKWRVSTVLNEDTPATLSLVEQSQPTFISATLAQTLGLEPERGAARESLRLGDRTLPVRRARLRSLRLGKFVFRDVTVVLLPAEAEDLGSQLATGALSGMKARVQSGQMVLELESLAAGRGATWQVGGMAPSRRTLVPFVLAAWPADFRQVTKTSPAANGGQ